MTKKTILSGMQPTGKLHLGRYFGAVQNWVNLQKDYRCFYSVVNYHAMTMPFNPRKLREQTWTMIYDVLACGVEPENIFIQSYVPEHTELAWILNCMCSYGELSRMTQFKDKAQQVKDSSKDAFISTGIFTYPVLQAADILIYKADAVPVGKDQDQHLELTRNIANRFNQVVGKEYFVLPETIYTQTPKILSTADPGIKMSASKGDKHHIDFFGDPDRIRKQIRSAVTDSGEGPRTEMSPGVENLFQILLATGNKALHDDLLVRYRNGSLMYGEMKSEIAEALVAFLEPFRQRRMEIYENRKEVKRQIKESSSEIRKVAQQTVREVKELVGL